MYINSLKFIIFLCLGFQITHGLLKGRNRSPRNLLLNKAQPCDKFVHVESHGVLSYLGNVTFSSPINFKGQWHLEMSTKEPFTFLGGWGVIIKEDGPNKHADLFSSKIADLKFGDQITFRFRMSYARGKLIPYVSLLKWEGRQLCGQTTESTRNSTRTGDIFSSPSTDNKTHLVITNNFGDHIRRLYQKE